MRSSAIVCCGCNFRLTSQFHSTQKRGWSDYCPSPTISDYCEYGKFIFFTRKRTPCRCCLLVLRWLDHKNRYMQRTQSLYRISIFRFGYIHFCYSTNSDNIKVKLFLQATVNEQIYLFAFGEWLPNAQRMWCGCIVFISILFSEKKKGV